jgi:fission process protein 1
LGLAAVPALPYLFDHPVEQAVEWTFHKGFEAVGGPDAVGGRPVTGNKELRIAESRAGAKKEKEL